MLTRQGTHFKPRRVPRWALGLSLAALVVGGAALASVRDRSTRDGPLRLLTSGSSTTRPAVTSTDVTTATTAATGVAHRGSGASATTRPRASSPTSGSAPTSPARTSRAVTTTTDQFANDRSDADDDAADDAADAADDPEDELP